MRKSLLLLVLLPAAVLAAGAAAVQAESALPPEVGAGTLPLGLSPSAHGGGAGYYFWDSTETDTWAPTYGWRNPVHHMGWRGDDTYWTTSLPFAVTFCGIRYNAGKNLYVGSNGIVGFMSSKMDEPINQDIPISASPNAIMAAFWDNLAGYSNGDISLDLVGTAPNRAFFITYSPWYYDLAPADPIAFQILIRETDVAGINNTIEFRYKDVIGDSWRDDGFSATVGLENNSGVTAASYSYNMPVITGQLAVRFVDSQFVDNQLGEFHLIAPLDGYVAMVGEWVDFQWQASEYTGSGVVTYELYLDDNPDFNHPTIFDIGTDTSFRYVFGSDDTGTYWWKVKATESILHLYKWSEETHKLIISDDAVAETTWGQIKATFE
ncbi:MAG: hypothetical protein A2Y64_05245 [Candidatus Coatesbacteria bacterium RBG_13_66_14]|uniref:Uncharacterized protein n=1 Tax=Candidatus Coatesbacteria bacterium RBG_13_66_14 TaxID=1817816 RepID=A0A1F5FEX0_9BACT|nr:MAG: hypothetical protein A2Y64_05245 [Candidatus Coatesbacteria bacterium RBG_13_66_14]